jgi:hypothetical protein
MEALREVGDNTYPNNTYLVSGNTLVAYCRENSSDKVLWLKTGIPFDKRYRKFVKADISIFDTAQPEDTIDVAGSNGNVYVVNKVTRKCSCPGFTYRGECKHIKLID